MRPADRMWWITALFACACLVGSIVAPIKILSDGLPAAERLGESITFYLLIAVVFVLIFLLGTVIFAVMSINPFRRQHLRSRAIKGHADAMPAARIAVHPEKAPNTSEPPLVLWWRTPKGSRFFWIVMGAFQLLILVAGAALYPVFYVIGWLQGQFVPWQDASTVIAGLISAICLTWLVVLLEVARRFAPHFFGRPYGVSATAEGVEYVTEFGGRRFLPWGEIRLFEVESASDGSLDYYIYGARTIVTWTSNASSNRDSEPVGVGSGEMTYRLQALVDLIAARTGLTPRTLSKRQQGEPEVGEDAAISREESASTAPWQIGCAIFVVAFAALPVALALAVLQVPFSDIQTLDDIIAASLAMTALLLVGLGVWNIAMARRTPRTAGEYVPVSAPASGPENTTYTFAYALPARLRIMYVISGLLLCIDALPFVAVASFSLVYWLAASVQLMFGDTPWPVTFPSFGRFVGYFMVPFAAGGPVLLWAGLSVATATVCADARGLTLRTRNRHQGHQALLWETVEKLTATRQGDRIIGYSASGGIVKIAWPGDLGRLRVSAHSGDVMHITPEELIALAAARTGLTIDLLTTDRPPIAG